MPINSPAFIKIFKEPNYNGGYNKAPGELYYSLYTSNYWKKNNQRSALISEIKAFIYTKYP